jgi:hypothetical protein
MIDLFGIYVGCDNEGVLCEGVSICVSLGYTLGCDNAGATMRGVSCYMFFL